MVDHHLTERVRETALASGAALVGFAPISRYDNAPPEVHPRTIFPQTQTAIAIAIPQSRGSLKTIEEGTYWQAYNADSYSYINEVMAPRVLREIVMALEAEGYMGVQIHNPQHTNTGRQIREDMPWGPDGKMSYRVLGVAAGLGELGMAKIFLTPQFGPRQRVYGVLTDAQLTPTPLFRGKVCDECKLCVKECEAQAIPPSRDITFTIEDVTYSHADLDCGKCAHVHTGRDPRYSPFWNGSEVDGGIPSYHQWC